MIKTVSHVVCDICAIERSEDIAYLEEYKHWTRIKVSKFNPNCYAAFATAVLHLCPACTEDQKKLTSKVEERAR